MTDTLQHVARGPVLFEKFKLDQKIFDEKYANIVSLYEGKWMQQLQLV